MDGKETSDIIRRNAFKSVAIVIAFPFVLPALLLLITLIVALVAGRPDATALSGRMFITSLIIMVAVTVLWLPIGYFLNQWIVDQATGARLVSRSELRSVRAVLDRLSTQCGIRTPALRVIETSALNAYASGLTQGSYCVTVTTGLVEALEDDELEGVLAHELTHIIHQDVRLMVVAGVLIGTVPRVHDVAMKAFWALVVGILNIYRAILVLLPMPGAKALAEISYIGLYWAGRIVAYGIGLVATFCSLMLQFALSRRREFMADAGAARMTGNPEALASALRKISGNATLDTALAAVCAMCIEIASLGSVYSAPTRPSRTALTRWHAYQPGRRRCLSRTTTTEWSRPKRSRCPKRQRQTCRQRPSMRPPLRAIGRSSPGPRPGLARAP